MRFFHTLDPPSTNYIECDKHKSETEEHSPSQRNILTVAVTGARWNDTFSGGAMCRFGMRYLLSWG